MVRTCSNPFHGTFHLMVWKTFPRTNTQPHANIVSTLHWNTTQSSYRTSLKVICEVSAKTRTGRTRCQFFTLSYTISLRHNIAYVLSNKKQGKEIPQIYIMQSIGRTLSKQYVFQIFPWDINISLRTLSSLLTHNHSLQVKNIVLGDNWDSYWIWLLTGFKAVLRHDCIPLKEKNEYSSHLCQIEWFMGTVSTALDDKV